MQRDRFALTLHDYRDELQWVREIGWSDQELQQVRVHEQATAGVEYINLTNWGGTPLGVSARGGGGSSAGVQNVRNLYAYKNEVPERLYNILLTISQRGGPSAFEDSGIFGERGEKNSFPPGS